MREELTRRSFIEESKKPLTQDQEKVLEVVLDLCLEGWIIYIDPDTDPDGKERSYTFGKLRNTVRGALGPE